MEVKVGHNSLRHTVRGRELHKITSERVAGAAVD